MKLVSFRHPATREAKWGVVDGDRIVPPATGVGLPTSAVATTENHALAEVALLPPIPDPAKIICIGLNYRAHVAEAGRALPDQPSLFVRFTDTLVAHNAPLVRPTVSDNFDFEGELALVIGKGGRHIPEDQALDHIAGYACFNDGSIRDWQKHSVSAGKNFPSTGGFGPWLVTKDEIPDPAALTLTTRLNGRVVQQASTDMLIFPIPRLISYVSAFTPLNPGDIIATGTPEGVGLTRTPPLWMKAGDVIEVEISGVGTLRNPVVDEG